MFSAHSTINNDQTGLGFTRHINDFIHVNILIFRTNPTTIEPQDIEVSVSFHQFPNLIVCKLTELLPSFRMIGNFIIHIPIWGCIIRPPIIRTMPVWFREISTDHEIFLPESIENIPCHIFLRAILKCTMGNREISFLRIVHTESVMVLGCKDDVTHSGIFHYIRPLIRIKVDRIERILQSPVPFLIVFIRPSRIPRNPIHVFRTNRP